VLALQHQWANPFISDFRWSSHIREAAVTACVALNMPTDHQFTFFNTFVNGRQVPMSLDWSDLEDSDPEGDLEVHDIDYLVLPIHLV